MALSMTGYGHGIESIPEYTVTVDLKSVNHRYLEMYFKIPKVYSFLEDKLRSELANRIARGKLEVSLIIEKLIPDQIQVELNKPLVSSYMKAIQEIQTDFQLGGSIDLHAIINLPDIFHPTQPAEDQEKLLEIAGLAFEKALESMIESRKEEGANLLKVINEKLNTLEELRGALKKWAPAVVNGYQEKLQKRIRELAGEIEIDPNRLAVEVAIYADKSDITEELDRIESHLRQFRRTLSSTEAIGRRLDFIIQELNREINTVGSKANDLRIAQTVIEFKAELEKVREQIQNIE